MENMIIGNLNKTYGTDIKVVRTGTKLFGKISEYDWMNIVNPPLSLKEINTFENEMGIIFPKPYKKLLSFMNGSFLSNLVRIAGRPLESKGLSNEEEYYQPFELESFQQLHFSKKMPSDYFVFADSLDLHTIYAFNEKNEVLELHMRNKKVLNNMGTLDEWLKIVIEEGEKIYMEYKK